MPHFVHPGSIYNRAPFQLCNTFIFSILHLDTKHSFILSKIGTVQFPNFQLTILSINFMVNNTGGELGDKDSGIIIPAIQKKQVFPGGHGHT